MENEFFEDSTKFPGFSEVQSTLSIDINIGIINGEKSTGAAVKVNATINDDQSREIIIVFSEILKRRPALRKLFSFALLESFRKN